MKLATQDLERLIYIGSLMYRIWKQFFKLKYLKFDSKDLHKKWFYSDNKFTLICLKPFKVTKKLMWKIVHVLWNIIFPCLCGQVRKNLHNVNVSKCRVICK